MKVVIAEKISSAAVDLLRELGIPVLEPYAESNLNAKPDLVVVGNALSRGNPEIERVLDERIPFTESCAQTAGNRTRRRGRRQHRP